MTAVKFATSSLEILAKSQDYATDYVKLRNQFYFQFQRGYVFATSITQDFFENVVYWVPRDDFYPGKGEYEVTFNRWLTLIRKSH